MLRPIPSLLALCAAMLTTAPVLAADYDLGGGSDDGLSFRDGYPTEPGDWAGLGDKDDPISLETGTRYWYSMGSQNFSSFHGLATSSESDTSHIGEVYLRIEDHSTNVWATALAGLSAKIDGNYAGPVSSTTISDGHIAYLGADIGWDTWGDNKGSGIGPMVGYMYLEDDPDTGRINYTTANSAADIAFNPATGQTTIPGASAANFVSQHLVRLGIAGKAKLGDFFDISGTVAAVPYAKVSGNVGIDDPTFSTAVYSGMTQIPYTGANGNISSIRASTTAIDGWGYGAQAEAFLGIHPTANLTMRLGGRAWYLQGNVDSTYSRALISNPGGGAAPFTAPTFSKTAIIDTNNPFKMFRYGLLAELSYDF